MELTEYNLNACLDTFQQMLAEKQRRIDEDGHHDYSLIHSLLKANDEVRLHSRFLYSMLNPQGLHYCGNQFLQAFLQMLPESLRGFIDPHEARIFREKDNIDLLIHDNRNFMIIENKLDAVDQKYQITRYIQHIQQKFFKYAPEGMSDHVAVIYLSKSRSIPTTDSESLIGFESSDTLLVWKGLPGKIDKLNDIELREGASFPFVHFPYFPVLQSWVEVCLKIAPPDGRRNAFEEYKLILQRLDPRKPWRKIMTLDQYVINELTEDKQEQMYAFMVESKKRLTDYVAHKLFQEIVRLFGEEIINNRGSASPLSANSIKKWLNEDGKPDTWKDIGFRFVSSSGEQGALVFGIDYVYLGLFGTASSVSAEPYKDRNQILKQPARPLLLGNSDGLFRFLEDLRKRYKSMGMTTSA